MASTYRRKGTAGRYRVKFRDAGGAWRDVLGFTDEKASDEMARKLERLASLRAAGEAPTPELSAFVRGLPAKLQTNLAKWGILDGTAHAGTKPLTKHLDDYKAALLAGVASRKQKGPATVKHAELVHKRVTTILDALGARVLAGVTAENVGEYLSGRRAKGRKDDGLSAQTSNNYLRAAKSFFNWLVRAGRATTNPLANVAPIQVTPKLRKHVRRPLEHDEAAALLKATRSGPTRYKTPAEERYWLYRLALETALRSSELRALTRENFELDDAEPFVWLPGDDTKNSEGAELPLRAETVAELRVYLANKLPKAVVFAKMTDGSSMATVLRADLKAAGVDAATDAGVVDFHSLRVTCLSWLADAGTPLKVLQDFARHSTPTLTMNVYARTLRGSMAGAAARLPDLTDAGRTAARATGTDDKTVLEITPKTTPKRSQKRASACASVHVAGSVGGCSTNKRKPYDTSAKKRTSVRQNASGVSGRLVGSAVFKAVEASFTRRLVGSIPIHSRWFFSGFLQGDISSSCLSHWGTAAND
jgi:integrase